MKPTQRLHDAGQSLWLDNITRDLLTSGTLKRYIDDLSVTGLTSNPAIFNRALEPAQPRTTPSATECRPTTRARQSSSTSPSTTLPGPACRQASGRSHAHARPGHDAVATSQFLTQSGADTHVLRGCSLDPCPSLTVGPVVRTTSGPTPAGLSSPELSPTRAQRRCSENRGAYP